MCLMDLGLHLCTVIVEGVSRINALCDERERERRASEQNSLPGRRSGKLAY